MSEPTPESVELARSILDQDGNPFVEYLAATVGQVMSLNYDGLAAIFDEHRAEFEARGAGDLLREIQSEVDNLFSGFIQLDGE